MSTEINIESLRNQLTEKDNFKKLMELRLFYDEHIKPSLKLNFWNALDKRITEMKENGELKDWNIHHSKTEFYIYHSDWKSESQDSDKNFSFGIGWNHIDGGDRRNLYYCIFTSRNLNDKKELYSQLKEVKSFNSLKIDEKSNNLLAWSYHKDYNMDAQNTLVDFLPEFLGVRVEEFLSVLLDLKNSYGSILNNFK